MTDSSKFDMLFDEEPVDLRRGQSLQLKLTLGDNSRRYVLIPNGSFYQDTGGNWLFVVSPDGHRSPEANRQTWGVATKILLKYWTGSSSGEEIITSPYTKVYGYGSSVAQRRLIANLKRNQVGKNIRRFRKMLKLHDLYKVYRTDEVETVALNGVNFEIDQGDFVAVMGPSGCGKSTLAQHRWSSG